jgi:Spy/CpxP family protein refolding chaperone
MSFLKQSLSLAVVIGVIGACLSPGAFAEESDPQPETVQQQSKPAKACHSDKHGSADSREKIKQALNLTPEQEEKIKALKEQNKSAWEEVRTKKQALKALKETNGSPEEIEAMQTELKALKTKLMEKHRAEMKTILTPEQQHKMEAFRAQHHKSKDHFDAKKQKPKGADVK